MWRIKSVSLDGWTDACCCFCFHLKRQSEGEESGGRARLWLAATAQVLIFSSIILLLNFEFSWLKLDEQTDGGMKEWTNHNPPHCLRGSLPVRSLSGRRERQKLVVLRIQDVERLNVSVPDTNQTLHMKVVTRVSFVTSEPGSAAVTPQRSVRGK